MGRFIVGLTNRRATREPIAGGKGASLARLLRAGFRVPPGFVITTAVFRGALTAAVRRMVTEAGPPDVENLEAIRRSFLSWDLLPAHRRAILRACRALGEPVAIRSSLVGEDSAGASLAGQLDSFLDVSGDENILAAVKKCLASALGFRLWSYLYQKDAPASERMSMAVVVQSMVNARVSGAASSADPASGERSVTIESVPGLGDGLTQGRVTPERHGFDDRGELVETPAGGPPLLDSETASELASTVRAIAAKFASPQDVEWAFDGHELFILQARPIASLTSRRIFSSRLVSGMVPTIVKPLVWSTIYQSAAENVVAPVFKELLGRSIPDCSGLLAKFHSRVYADVTRLDELAFRAGLPAGFFEAVTRDEAPAASWKIGFRPRLVPPLVRAVRYALRQLRVVRRTRRFVDARRRELENFQPFDWASAAEGSLLERLGRLVELHNLSRRHMIHVSLSLIIRKSLAGRWLRKWAPGRRPGDVLQGYGRRGTLQPYEGIARLAAEARDLEPRLLARIAAGESADIRAELSSMAEGRNLLSHFDTFMSRFGFLSPNGGDFSEVPWVETPRLVWRIVARVALARSSTLWDLAEARRRDSLRRTLAGLNPVRRLIFGRAHDAAVRLMAAREKLSLVMAEEAHDMRRCALAIGSRLAARGAISDGADVFYLYEDELRRIVTEPREAARAREIVGARKTEVAADAALEPPETILGEAPPGLPTRPAAARRPYLEGIGASPGIVTGRARIIRDPFLARDSRPGERDIVIATFADAGWMPFLSGAGGIVSETGGELSHASVIAREFGLPAVVGSAKATSLIREGELITVDGTAGRVYLQPADEPRVM